MIRGIFDLWPLILIIIGIGIIFKNDLLNTILWILFLVVLVVYSFFIKDNMFEKNPNEILKAEVYTTEMKSNIERGNLELDVGATSFNIGDIDGDFIKLEQDGAFNYKFNNKKSIETLYLSNKNNFISSGKNRSFELGLNRDIPWDFNIDIGAVSGNLNLKEIMVRHISLDMGAGSLEMTLGEKNKFTSIDIDAGASKLVINVPKDVGLKVNFDGGLNSTNLDEINLVEIDKGNFISDGYEDTSSKYEIEVDMGVGKFEINYY